MTSFLTIQCSYLYWSEMDSGIYRVPLPASSVDATTIGSILSLSGLSAFTVNSESLQILYSNSTGNSLHSASLDGSDQSEVRVGGSGNLDHKFVNTTSIVYFNSTFTWTHIEADKVKTCLTIFYSYTDRENLYFEETPNGAVSTVALFVCEEGYHGLDIFHPTYQPIPVPIFPPTSLQVLFTGNTADISWTRPKSLPGLGTLINLELLIRGWAEKFIVWLWCNGPMWPNVFIFQQASFIGVAALGVPWYRSSHPDPQKSPQLQIRPHHLSDTVSQPSVFFSCWGNKT